jgi:ubiquinone/menaquinone biosynthesis C-methylase UbiE
MSTPSHPPKPHYSGTYFVQDPQNEEELVRLATQDRVVTAAMGGVLAEQADPHAFRHVLDVACGAGAWCIEAAKNYPEMSLVGIDVNPHIIAYAHARATAYQVADRVKFQVMDALYTLDFADASFDLVNMRFAISFLRTWDWPKVLRELMRVLRPGGVVRLTDEEVIHQSTSPAAMQFCEMLQCALFRSCHLFSAESTGITAQLAPLLRQQGFQDVQTKAYALQFRAGTPEGKAYAEDGIHVLRTLKPFIQKWGCISTDYNTLREQVREEVLNPDFCATWNLLTAWGRKSLSKGESLEG